MNAVLAVTGCIGAYKAAYILRLLQQEGFEVIPAMTRSAQQFLGPLTLEKLAGRKVLTDLFQSETSQIEHISAARESEILVVAPATANILAKFAAGIADDFLSTLYLSTTTPVVVAPAMNVEMWRHPATVENCARLRERGVVVVDPGTGYQACGEYGEGRLAEPEEIVAAVLETLGMERTLKGRRIVITAGPTVEDIDPVRFISNRSSGKMGYALAREAARRGGAVELISGPTQLEPPAGVSLTRVRSAAEMAEAVFSKLDRMDIFVASAAVSDYAPAEPSAQKLKKTDAGLSLRLKRTKDILAEVSERVDCLVVGFAAESENLAQNARKKLESKGLDLIVANDIGGRETGFAADDNSVWLLDRRGREETLPRMSKIELAKRIWDRIEALTQEDPVGPVTCGIDSRTEVDH